jgi:hypothetical protein
MSDFYIPPTIQEMPRDDPEDHLALIHDTALDMLNMNEIYTGKSITSDAFAFAFEVHVLGIKNSLRMGTAIARQNAILFLHPGTGEYVPYDKELQAYLLGFIRETKQAVQRVAKLSSATLSEGKMH